MPAGTLYLVVCPMGWMGWMGGWAGWAGWADGLDGLDGYQGFWGMGIGFTLFPDSSTRCHFVAAAT